jgi:hypothetical protein
MLIIAYGCLRASIFICRVLSAHLDRTLKRRWRHKLVIDSDNIVLYGSWNTRRKNLPYLD